MSVRLPLPQRVEPMKFQPVHNGYAECFPFAIGLLAGADDKAIIEVEWEVRRLAYLVSVDRLPMSQARRKIEAERIGEPWAKWPDDYPRF